MKKIVKKMAKMKMINIWVALLLVLSLTYTPLVSFAGAIKNTAATESMDVENSTGDPMDEPEDPMNPMDEFGPIVELMEELEADVCANSISEMLWLDMYDDIGNGIYAGDGIRQVQEVPLADYSVELYKAADVSSRVSTAVTDADGRYEFTSLEPDTYIISIKSETISGTEYLLPLVGIAGDNKFSMADDYVSVFTEPIEVDEEMVIVDMDAGMRISPKPILRAAYTSYQYYGRLADQTGIPIYNAQVFMAILYTTNSWGTCGALISTVKTDENGSFTFTNSVSASTAFSWDDDVILVMGFPSPFPESMAPNPYAGSVTGYTSGRGSLAISTYTRLSANKFNHPHGFSSSLYRIATYDLQALESNVLITIGNTSSRQEIKVGGTADYIVTENFYDLDTGSVIERQRLSSFGTIYTSDKFTGKASNSIQSAGKTYQYYGYRLNTTSGLITKGSPPSYTVDASSVG